MTSGPLHGIRILDLTHVWAGPLAVRFLADLGADVVRIEAPFGRGPKEFPYTPLGGYLGGAAGDDPWNTNAIFVKLMRNRRSLCVDLKEEFGRQLFLELVAQADVVVENFSAGAMERLQLGYETMREVNARIIHVSMPGFGNYGPLSQRVAFGPTVEAMSGLTDVLGYDKDDPKNTAMALMDPICGTHAYAAVNQALVSRRDSGFGCHIEMSLHEGGVNYSGPWLLDRQLGNEVQTWGNRHPMMVPHGVFASQGDDEWVVVACADQLQWQALLTIFAEEGITIPAEWSATMTLSQRRECEVEIEACIATIAARFSKEALTERMQQAGIAAGPVNTTPDMTADDQVKFREFFVDYERHATPIPGTAVKMASLDPQAWTRCPKLGEHNTEVLAEWLGYDDEKLIQATTSGVVHAEPPG